MYMTTVLLFLSGSVRVERVMKDRSIWKRCSQILENIQYDVSLLSLPLPFLLASKSK
jgi:hypothetical protein